VEACPEFCDLKGLIEARQHFESLQHADPLNVIERRRVTAADLAREPQLFKLANNVDRIGLT
jgi:hypothetical protein